MIRHFKFIKIFIFAFSFILFNLINIYSLNYITTAESISWNGAYTSVADGFESMLYNPAGLYMTTSKFGLNLFGSYGFRSYNNTFTSDNSVDLLLLMENGTNLTRYGLMDQILFYMPAAGLDVGYNLSFGNIMTFVKLPNFSFGISILPKTSISGVIDKNFFLMVFDKINLDEEMKFKLKAVLIQYIDFVFSLSTRARFLEKYIPIQKIYAGLNLHVYMPTLYVRADATARLNHGNPNPEGFIDNYNFNIKGQVSVGGNGAFTNIYKNIPIVKDYFNKALEISGSAAFGIGLDAGFILQFNRIVRLGFSVTDLGFMVFPTSALISLNYDFNLSTQNSNLLQDFNNDLEDLLNDNVSYGTTEWYMAPTAFRLGLAIIPFKNEILTFAIDVALADLNNIIYIGYPVFNFSMGIEFLPGYNWFHVPLRAAFNYNSQANAPSFSFGAGFYIGPVEMEVAVKGVEFLIKDWGAKDICIGADLKFEF